MDLTTQNQQQTLELQAPNIAGNRSQVSHVQWLSVFANVRISASVQDATFPIHLLHDLKSQLGPS